MWRLATVSLARFLRGPFQRRGVRLRSTIEQIVRAGHSSLPLVGLICFLAGMIMALQSAYQLNKMGAVDLVADLVAISITRELAPLLTAIIVTGRFGSAVTAELGTMKVSQEIDALTVMGLEPISFLVVPRLVALAISLPCLTIFADLIGIAGGMSVATLVLEMGVAGYLAKTVEALALQDIYTGLVKAFVFALIIGLICCQRGLATRGGAEEVGRSTTISVVRSIALIVGADLFVTALFYLRG
ncbi:MAG: ABC transporter permease [Acidobacteriota bacterium]|nr:MAG: ABC transporter permease [Acidobacteriota bacterium]